MKKHYQCYRYPMGVAYGKQIYGSYLLENGEGKGKENAEPLWELDVDSVDVVPQKDLTDAVMEELFPIRFCVQNDRLIAGTIIPDVYDDYGDWPQPLLILETKLDECDFLGVGMVPSIKLTCLDLTTLNDVEPETYTMLLRINPAKDEEDLEFATPVYFRRPDEPLHRYLRKREVVKLEVKEDGILVVPEDVEWEDDGLI